MGGLVVSSKRKALTLMFFAASYETTDLPPFLYIFLRSRSLTYEN